MVSAGEQVRPEAVSRRRRWPRWPPLRRNGFWWVLPVLVGNVVVAGWLPVVFSADEGVPIWLLGVEWATRLVVVTAPLVMAVDLTGWWGRAGLALYVGGVLTYGAAWVLLVAGGDAYVDDHLQVALVPYWAPGVFFSGLAVMARAPWYLLPVLLFTVAHTAHGLIVLGLAPWVGPSMT